ncbi:TPA: lycopene beta-cyclase CrtY [Citrobacter freundii]
MNHDYDLILVGGGLANGLIAWRLHQLRPEIRLVVLESEEQIGGNHTWSFHGDDLSADRLAWIAPLIAHRWQGYDVRFPRLRRTLHGAYFSITSDHFAAVLTQALGKNLRVSTPVAELAPRSVTLRSGDNLSAAAVIDGRGYKPGPHLITGAQAFLGQHWRLSEPHGLTRPILMDATVDQQDGYRFVYTLPFTDNELLIEDTHYIDRAMLNPAIARQNIHDYIRQQRWKTASLIREEQGILPIMLAGQHQAFWDAKQNQPCSGLRAGLFHATTGYSLPHAVALADIIARQASLDAATLFPLIQRHAQSHWRRQRFFRVLNRMLFLAGRPDNRWQVMQRFYRLNEGLIARFYAGEPTLADIARILSGKPPVPLGEALLAICKTTSRLRAFNHG